jgi:hypothetical protein
MPHQLTIQPTDLQKIIKQLQILEQNQELNTIEGLLPSQFLRYAIQPINHAESPKNRVKTILLHLADDYQTHAAQLSDKLHLKTHLLFTEVQYKLLFLKLNALLQHYQPEGKISIKEIKDCQVVYDCVTLVERNL